MIYCCSFNGRKGVVDLSVSAGKVYLERLIYLITSGSQKAKRRALGAIQAKLYDIFSLSFSDIYEEQLLSFSSLSLPFSILWKWSARECFLLSYLARSRPSSPSSIYERKNESPSTPICVNVWIASAHPLVLRAFPWVRPLRFMV